MKMRRILPTILLLGAWLGACASSPTTTTEPMATTTPPPPATTSAGPVASVAPPPPTCAPGTTLDGDHCVADAPPPPKPPCAAGMALVPGGSYPYGQKKEEVKVEPICMDLTETTAESFAACVKAGKCADTLLSRCAAQATYGVPEKANHPIVCVDFSQASSYCSFVGKRLPTDEEWEWAARGGTKGTRYAWGDDTPKDQLCWSGNGAQKGTCAVGSFPRGANPQGILDLTGGVFEFTTTKNDEKSVTRVGRGGSWKDGTEAAFRSSRVGGFGKTYRCGFLGIRCVAPPDPAALASLPPPAPGPAPASSAAR
jgi:formylglycine-generating enzyme required for sulfatase activity